MTSKEEFLAKSRQTRAKISKATGARKIQIARVVINHTPHNQTLPYRETFTKQVYLSGNGSKYLGNKMACLDSVGPSVYF